MQVLEARELIARGRAQGQVLVAALQVLLQLAEGQRQLPLLQAGVQNCFWKDWVGGL